MGNVAVRTSRYAERNETIKALRRQHPNWTVDQIGAALGLTRGTVTGVLDRAGLLNGTWIPNPRVAPRSASLPRAVCEEVASGSGVGLLSLKESHCRWPIGRGGNGLVTFCGWMKVTKSSYCEEHFKRSRGAPAL